MPKGLTNPASAIGYFWLAGPGYFPRVPKHGIDCESVAAESFLTHSQLGESFLVLIAAAVGTYVCARIAKETPLFASACFGMALVFVILIGFAFSMGTPDWFFYLRGMSLLLGSLIGYLLTPGALMRIRIRLKRWHDLSSKSREEGIEDSAKTYKHNSGARHQPSCGTVTSPQIKRFPRDVRIGFLVLACLLSVVGLILIVLLHSLELTR